MNPPPPAEFPHAPRRRQGPLVALVAVVSGGEIDGDVAVWETDSGALRTLVRTRGGDGAFLTGVRSEDGFVAEYTIDFELGYFPRMLLDWRD